MTDWRRFNYDNGGGGDGEGGRVRGRKMREELERIGSMRPISNALSGVVRGALAGDGGEGAGYDDGTSLGGGGQRIRRRGPSVNGGGGKNNEKKKEKDGDGDERGEKRNFEPKRRGGRPRGFS